MNKNKINEKTTKINEITGYFLCFILVVIICTYIWFDISLYLTEINFIMIGDSIAYCFPFIIGLLVTAQFSLMTLLLKQRFASLNEKLFQMQVCLNSELTK